ncbi:23S rRNA (adenine(2030)-N(6))-methyltransferase RlmJ [Neiella marina]|uniref:Ribosomal RNA large subunit methyltransferase J n=1 Tax=Neiella holothuriorum TaxID=2870530 RepID=A0ABS7EFJ1_9GAMM|nr:23S rRNA (adenine(2030)-N(6))-methyltransferase RlmJ [Neiella holothuriorum]MBW8191103.1 23S rRNA (adenine(2030)-N(6))-methyltransferase RlmJ [Neiella holothuriorum]
MLSYRHSFHAGNFADVLKHIVLVETIAHLQQKPKAFDYIDTHSGAGLYNLASADAGKLSEHEGGIGKLSRKQLPELKRYFDLIEQCQQSSKVRFYPGSPMFAKLMLRQHDKAWLTELHPQDFKHLSNNMGKTRQIRISQEDGLKRLKAVLPPQSRRALVLIDPSYEIKSEYQQVFDAIAYGHKKFATGVYALWYPVVERERIDKLDQQFIDSGIRNIQRFELGIGPDSDEKGMTSSGMYVVNPPWKLFATMEALLPKLAQYIGEGDSQYFKCEQLVAE